MGYIVKSKSTFILPGILKNKNMEFILDILDEYWMNTTYTFGLFSKTNMVEGAPPPSSNKGVQASTSKNTEKASNWIKIKSRDFIVGISN
jgi:hypothetical protein